MAYEICENCIDQDECYIWHAVEQLKEQLPEGCPFKVNDEEEDDKEIKNLIRYEMMHDGAILHTMASEDPSVAPSMINLMVLLSDENEGDFSLWTVEKDPETNREKYTQIAAAKSGVEI